MMGAAAAKYLAVDGMRTLLVGPEEGNAAGIHGSHHDQARITRYSGPDLTWSRLAARSMQRFAGIERESGIRFHQPCGHLRCDLPTVHPASHVDAVCSVLAHMPSSATRIHRDEVVRRFPYLTFASNSVFHYEPGPAGIINPRNLVRAQCSIGEQHGMTLLRDVVTGISRKASHFEVRVGSDRIKAANVLTAAGSYTSMMDLVPSPLAFSVRPETVLLVKVDGHEAGKWEGMPGIIWHFDDHPEVPYAYILPPVRYDDGNMYIKIGADHDKDVAANSVSSFDTYMRGNGSHRTTELLRDLLLKLIPSLRGAPYHGKPCMLTYTSTGYPYIDEVSENWFVAAGGCGASAKSSDTIGYLASRMILRTPWPEAFDSSLFRVGSGGPVPKTIL